MRKWYAGFSLVVAAVGVVPGAKPCKSAGITRVYRVFPGIPAKYPVFCRFWPQNSLRHGSEPPPNDEFHGVSRGFPRKLEGVVGKRAGNTERKPGRVREETLVQAKALSGGDETFVSEVLAAMEGMEVGDIRLGDSCDL